MIKDYVVNSVILVAFISIIYQIFRETGISPLLPLKSKIFLGCLFGALGVMLMIFGIVLPNQMIVDFRNFPIFLSAILCGGISTVVCTSIIATYRLLVYGINLPSITAIIVMITLAISSYAIVKLKTSILLKWLLATGSSLLTSYIALGILIKDPILQCHVIISYCIGLSLISVLIYYYIQYIEHLTLSFIHYKQDATSDFLTGLNNVRQFNKLYNTLLNNDRNAYNVISLLYIDVDFFKKINDTYGHYAGDIVLKKLSEVLTTACRNNDIISRNGGEEFSVILIDCPPNTAILIAERIRTTIEHSVIELPNQTKINVTVSIGVASYPHPIRDFNALVDKADAALYEAKNSGRNRVIVYKEE